MKLPHLSLPSAVLFRLILWLFPAAQPAVGHPLGVPGVLVSGVASESWVHVADLDQDGDGDVLYSPFPGRLDQLRRMGDGSWSSLTLFEGGGVVRVLGAVTLDADGDGKMDVAAYIQKVVNGQPVTGIRVLRQGLWGLYQAAGAVDVPVGAFPAPQAPMKVADLDRDGRPDLIMAWSTAAAGTGNGRVSWLRNTGGGTLAAPVSLLFQAFDAPCSLAVGDWNRDGHPDVAVADNARNRLRLYPGPLFNQGQTLSLSGAPRHLEANDYNRDGWPDLVVATGPLGASGNMRFEYFFGSAGGWTPQDSLINLSLSSETALVMGDMNLDGRMDLFVAEKLMGNQRARLILDRGDGKVSSVPGSPVQNPLGAVALHDDDGDGDLDVFVATADGVARIPNITPHRRLYPPAEKILSKEGSAPLGATCFATGGFGLTRRQSVASASSGDGKIRVYYNHGGSQMTALPVADNPGCRWLAPADIDLDGIPDLVAPHLMLNRVVWYKNNGNGGWTEKVIPIPVSMPMGIAAGDINGDGRPDIVVAGTISQQVYLLTNPADGQSWTSTPVGAVSGVIRLEVADLVPGGALEMVTQHGSDGKVSLIRQSGGKWTVSNVFAGLQGSSGGEGLAVADVDGNGLLDILAGSGSSCLAVRQTSPGKFAPAQVVGTPALDLGDPSSVIRSIRTADLNLDGLPEVVAVYDSGILAHRWSGPGDYYHPAVVLMESGGKPPGDVALVRFDEDALPDAVHPDVSGTRVAAGLMRAPSLTLEVLPAFAGNAAMTYPVQPNMTLPLLRIRLTSHGFGEDAMITLKELPLQFRVDDAQLKPWTTADVNDTFPSLSFHQDLGTVGTLEKEDMVIASVAPGNADAQGWIKVELAQGATVPAGSTRDFMVATVLGTTYLKTFRIDGPSLPGHPAGEATVMGSGGNYPEAVQLAGIGQEARFAYGALSARQQWRSFHFSIPSDSYHAANSADPDGDGLSNLLEYALGLNPRVADRNQPLSLSRDKTHLFLQFRSPILQPDTSLTIHGSKNLKQWNIKTIRKADGAWNCYSGTIATGPSDGASKSLIYSVPLIPDQSEFFRLEAHELAP